MARDLRRIPLFPLPNVVFFPETQLPLHIFEPRYRQMVEEAWSGDRMIGMALIQAAGHQDLEPELCEIGCAGEIISLEPLDDGRFDIVLEGRFRFLIDREEDHSPYRVAEVQEAPIAPIEDSVRSILRSRLAEKFSRLAESVGRIEAGQFDSAVSDEGLVNHAAQRLGLQTEECYRLLAMSTLVERYSWVLSHIESTQERVDLLAPYRGLAEGAERN